MRLSALLLLPLAAGCDDRARPAPPPAASPAGAVTPAPGPAPAPATVSPAVPVAAEPAPPATRRVAPAPALAPALAPVVKEHPGGSTVLRAVRTGVAGGATQLVFEFDARVPSYRVEYAAAVQECGSGEDVALPGSARLVVAFRNASAHDDEGRATVADRDRRPGLPDLLALRLFCDFEGDVSWAAALPRRISFTVSELAGPPRLLVRLAPNGGR